MAQRLMEVVVPEADADAVLEMLDDRTVIGCWRDIESGHLLIKALVSVEGAESLLDELQRRFFGTDRFTVLLVPVTAAIPRPVATEEAAEPARGRKSYRASREELYAEAADSIRTSPIFVALTALSAVVASIGLLNDNIVAVIGAMMIAPLLAPNVTLALGTTLGDVRLIRDALKANLVGVSIALLLAVAIGAVFHVDPATPAVAARTVVTWTDLVLALAAGGAGALAFTTGLPSAVIGVMVAVALLPPLVNFGVLVGGGQFAPALGAFLLLVANVVCVNLAGVLTFLAQGVRPRTWWETRRARHATRIAMTIWATLLTVLALTLFLSRPQR
jgi:uncharacterized hydrophobic protein (TIGR00341 family)